VLVVFSTGLHALVGLLIKDDSVRRCGYGTVLMILEHPAAQVHGGFAPVVS